LSGVAASALCARLPNAGARGALDAVRALLAGASERLANALPGRATAELTLIAAAFGLWTVPASAAPYARDLSRALTPRPPSRPYSSDGGGGGGCSSGSSFCGASDSGHASGSGCGSSSCGSSCGSGCGGGGGGGGCGGGGG